MTEAVDNKMMQEWLGSTVKKILINEYILNTRARDINSRIKHAEMFLLNIYEDKQIKDLSKIYSIPRNKISREFKMIKEVLSKNFKKRKDSQDVYEFRFI